MAKKQKDNLEKNMDDLETKGTKAGKGTKTGKGKEIENAEIVDEKGIVTQEKKEVSNINRKMDLSTEGYDMSFMDAGTRLGLNAKGQFVSKDDESHIMNEINAIITECSQKFVLWGADGDYLEGELIVSSDGTLEDAQEQFNRACVIDPKLAESYSIDDIVKRLIVVFMNIEDDDMYLIDLAPTSKFSFGNYYKKLILGRQEGVPKGTVPSEVNTLLSTESRKRGKTNFNVVTFNFVEML